MELVTVDFDRRLHATVDAVQRSLLAALKQQGFKIVRSEAGRLEARRGSQWRAALGAADLLPLHLDVAMSGHDGSSWVRCHLAEAERFVSDPTAASRQYAPVFWTVQGAVDGALARLDPAAPAEWSEPRFEVHETQQGPVPGQVTSAAPGAASPPPGADAGPYTPPGYVIFSRTDGKVAVLDPDDFAAQQTVIGLIASVPGALPANLATELEEFAAKLDRVLGRGANPGGRVDVSDHEQKVVEFLAQQVVLRKRLPVRQIYKCRECRFEKIVNPDLTRLQQKSRRWRTLTGLAGIGLSPAGVNVFVLAGRLFNLRSLDPDFMCPRCQGLEADLSLATICPGCGSIRKEPVLRRCPDEKCRFDFRTLLEGGVAVWQDPPPPQPVPEPMPAPVAPAPEPIAVVEAPAVTEPVVVTEPVPEPVPAMVTEPEPATATPIPLPAAGWYPDPYRRFEQRWWDGRLWTAWVANGGVVGADQQAAG